MFLAYLYLYIGEKRKYKQSNLLVRKFFLLYIIIVMNIIFCPFT